MGNTWPRTILSFSLITDNTQLLTMLFFTSSSLLLQPVGNSVTTKFYGLREGQGTGFRQWKARFNS